MQTRGIVVGLAFGGTLRGWYASQRLILTSKGGPVLLDLGRNCGRFGAQRKYVCSKHGSWLNETLGSQAGVAGNNLDPRRWSPIFVATPNADLGSNFPVHAGNADLKRIMATAESIVFVIDDDPSFRRSTEMLIGSAGLTVRAFSSAEEFLRSRRPDAPGCLLLDVRLPHLSGLDLQGELTKAGVQIPIIFITGHGDIPMTVQAMKAGALEFLTKPFREQDLLDGIQRAINFDRATRLQREKLADLRGRYQALTAREREVMARVVTGMLNKQIADALGITEKTVKVHRGHIMQKMEVRSLADLVRTAEKLGIFGHTS